MVHDASGMQIDSESIEEFKRIYRKEFGEKISDEEAQEMAQRLLILYELLARPVSGETKRKRRGNRKP